jgi:hypothetical protein
LPGHRDLREWWAEKYFDSAEDASAYYADRQRGKQVDPNFGARDALSPWSANRKLRTRTALR